MEGHAAVWLDESVTARVHQQGVGAAHLVRVKVRVRGRVRVRVSVHEQGVGAAHPLQRACTAARRHESLARARLGVRAGLGLGLGLGLKGERQVRG